MSFEEFLIPALYSFEEQKLIRRAFKLAREKHAGQKRASGAPYITHPLAVAEILMSEEAPADVVAAGLLHDTLEDTDEEFSELQRLFGVETAKMVDAVTKSQRMLWVIQHYPEKKKQELHHYFFEIVQDAQTALVKLADRLANMRTIKYLSAAKQIENARETVEMYVPLAKELGKNQIAAELEAICRKILPEAEYEICLKMAGQYKEELKKQGTSTAKKKN